MSPFSADETKDFLPASDSAAELLSFIYTSAHKKLIRRWQSRTWQRRLTLRWISIYRTHCGSQ